ncbi:MAG: tRNA 2-thiouridine(34) synthase MnmA [Planctomycetaceae bacterium]|jgi:tRNA-specific 2-thiouridylase|nr:tRNA 2-thiouridine(34) synthase MnmA [Planctomycetaceae bacterium]
MMDESLESPNRKAMVAMSGGVDSSVAAFLMKEHGFDCCGVTMKLFRNEDVGLPREKACCSLTDAEDARSVAEQLGIPFYVFNFADDFKTDVMERFIAAYQNGTTPNPCIDCNRYIKFGKLFRRAREFDYEILATGHYSRIERDAGSGRMLLKKSLDPAKDQSYVLYAMTQDQLARTVFPLGGLQKARVREIAAEYGFSSAAKRDSQDICFVPSGDYARFIEQSLGRTWPEGDVTDKSGKKLGRHRGIIHYTVGQRKGLGLAMQKPYYVCAKCAETNTIILGEESDLNCKALEAGEINLIACGSLPSPRRVRAKVRYRTAEQTAVVEQTAEDRFRVEFDEPQRGVAPGQAVVLYDGEIVLGGGTILRTVS